MSRLARRVADAALSVAGGALCIVGGGLFAFCLFTDAPTGDDQREALAAAWRAVVHLVTP